MSKRLDYKPSDSCVRESDAVIGEISLEHDALIAVRAVQGVAVGVFPIARSTSPTKGIDLLLNSVRSPAGRVALHVLGHHAKLGGHFNQRQLGVDFLCLAREP
jgi:hypothetical protein